MKRGKHFTLLSFFSKRVGKISSLRRGINNRLKYFTIKMDLRTRNSRNLNLLRVAQVFHELLYNAGYRDSRVLFAIHRFYPSPLQSFIRSRNVIRTPSPPNLSQKLLLLVMKLTVDCHASSLPGKGELGPLSSIFPPLCWTREISTLNFKLFIHSFYIYAIRVI